LDAVEDQQETIAQLKSDAIKQEAATIELQSTVAPQQNGADGISDMAGNAAMGSGRAERARARYNGADGISDMAGNAAMGSGRAERERARYNRANGMSDIEHVAIGNRAGRRQRS
jgi:hypothetical protein